MMNRFREFRERSAEAAGIMAFFIVIGIVGCLLILAAR